MRAKQENRNCEVSQVVSLTLGGFPQKVLLEGKRRESPVVITLHGGPGSPVPMGVGCRGLLPEFTDRFVMVYWDQLGCGVNNYPIDDSFTVDSFVDMTIDLVGEVKRRFPGNKVYFFATSWGSVLSAKALAREPGLVDGVVANGQIVRNLFFNEEVFSALAAAGVSERKLSPLRGVTAETYTPRDMQTISSLLMGRTDAYRNPRGGKVPMGKFILGMLRSPDYTFRDFQAVAVNGYRENRSLWRELLALDLGPALAAVQAPYTILQGDTDLVASTAVLRELTRSAGNPNLRLTVVEHTGHYPSAEMMAAILRALEEAAGRESVRTAGRGPGISFGHSGKTVP